MDKFNLTLILYFSSGGAIIIRRTLLLKYSCSTTERKLLRYMYTFFDFQHFHSIYPLSDTVLSTYIHYNLFNLYTI